jgi:hypothetical protein
LIVKHCCIANPFEIWPEYEIIDQLQSKSSCGTLDSLDSLLAFTIWSLMLSLQLQPKSLLESCGDKTFREDSSP